MRMRHKFVDLIPEEKEDGVIYISLKYNTATHLCCCGCGYKVITPFSPVDWQLIYNGEHVSLYPSIGNWDYPCKSHYWISKGKIKWARNFSEEEIELARQHDQRMNEQYYYEDVESKLDIDDIGSVKRNWWSWMLFWKK